MAVREYIGARYVTKVYENSLDPSSAEWEAGVTYEPLTMVTYLNSSYLSKKEVPGSIGDPASNPSYWVVTGAYNGQILNLQNQIDDLKGKYLMINVKDFPFSWGIDNLKGDNVTDDTTALNDAITYIVNNFNSVYSIYGQCRIALFFPNGIYKISGTVTLPPYFDIVGENLDSVSFYTDNITDPIFVISGHNRIEEINLQNTNGNLSTNIGFKLVGDQIEFYNVRVYNFFYDFKLIDAQGAKFENIYAFTNVSNAIAFGIEGRCVSSKWFRVNILATSVTTVTGIKYESGNYCMDLHFLFVEMSRVNYGFVLDGNTTTNPGDIFITDSLFDLVGVTPFHIENINSTGNVIISDCWVNFEQRNAPKYGLYASNANNIKMSGCRIEGLNTSSETYAYGCYFADCSGCIFVNNSMLNLKYAVGVVVADHMIFNDNLLMSDRSTSGTAFASIADLDRGSINGNKMHASITPFSYDIVKVAGRYMTNTFVKNNSLECTTPQTITDVTCIIDDNMN